MIKNDSIILKGINKFYGPKQVLKDIDLQVQNGEVYGLLGPSGCGKTTIVKIIVGILEATSGEAYVLDTRMPNLQIMNKIGYMAQADALYGVLTAEENLRFFGSLYGLSKARIKQRMEEVMALVNLSDDLKKPVQEYSGGMKRRLSLAISLLHSPPVLVLDEPTVGIDPLLRKSIWKELNNLAEQGATILLTTHVMDEADKCHSLAMMRDGLLIAQGTPAELQANIGVKSIEDAFIYYGGGQNEG
jgi:ABC-2 type transport system ATP-binding protein